MSSGTASQALSNLTMSALTSRSVWVLSVERLISARTRRSVASVRST